MVYVARTSFLINRLLRFKFEPPQHQPSSSKTNLVVLGLLSRNRTMSSSTSSNGAQKVPLVLFCGGSFNPVTNMHLRMFELAKDYFKNSSKYNLVSAIASPVGDAYRKKGLIEAKHRCAMLLLALEGSDWVKTSCWEADQPEWVRTIDALTYHKEQARKEYGDNVELMLLCGGDLLETFAMPNIWKEEDIDNIVSKFGIVVISRSGSDPEKFVYEKDVLHENKSNIHLVTNWIANEISSTKIRRALQRDESIKYLVPASVEAYVHHHGLYKKSPK